MAEIIPAILPKNFQEIEDKTSEVVGVANFVQIDICDGKFVPSKTWPFTKNAEYDIEGLQDERIGLPHYEELDYEFDLMVDNPLEKVPLFISLGASRVVVHARSADEETLHEIFDEYGKHENGTIYDIELGLALESGDSVGGLESIIEKAHFVQIMGIKNVGFQGQEFSRETIEVVSSLRKAFPELVITVDGGVSLDNASELIEAGADRLVVGSAIFESGNVPETIAELKML